MRLGTIFLLIALASCSWGDRLTVVEARQDRLGAELSALDAQQHQIAIELTTAQTDIENQRGDARNLAANVQGLESRFESFKKEVAGIGIREVKLIDGDEFHTLFGNQSGFNARVTVSNHGRGQNGKADQIFVKLMRIPKPSDSTDDENTELPIDFETTEELDLSADGASREVRIPCGFEITGRANGIAYINMRVQYDDEPCAG